MSPILSAVLAKSSVLANKLCTTGIVCDSQSEVIKLLNKEKKGYPDLFSIDFALRGILCAGTKIKSVSCDLH